MRVNGGCMDGDEVCTYIQASAHNSITRYVQITYILVVKRGERRHTWRQLCSSVLVLYVICIVPAIKGRTTFLLEGPSQPDVMYVQSTYICSPAKS